MPAAQCAWSGGLNDRVRGPAYENRALTFLILEAHSSILDPLAGSTINLRRPHCRTTVLMRRNVRDCWSTHKLSSRQQRKVVQCANDRTDEVPIDGMLGLEHTEKHRENSGLEVGNSVLATPPGVTDAAATDHS